MTRNAPLVDNMNPLLPTEVTATGSQTKLSHGPTQKLTVRARAPTWFQSWVSQLQNVHVKDYCIRYKEFIKIFFSDWAEQAFSFSHIQQDSGWIGLSNMKVHHTSYWKIDFWFLKNLKFKFGMFLPASHESCLLEWRQWVGAAKLGGKTSWSWEKILRLFERNWRHVVSHWLFGQEVLHLQSLKW